MAGAAWLVEALFFLSARLFGMGLGMMRDPLQVVLVICAIGVGLSSFRVWWVVVPAIFCAAMIAIFSYPRYREIGLEPWDYIPASFLLRFVVVILLGLLARGARRCFGPRAVQRL